MAASASLPAVDGALTSLGRRAADAARQLDLDLSAELYDALSVLGASCGATERAAEGVAGAGYVAHLRGDLATAAALYERALGATTDPDARGTIRARLGFARYDQGDLEAARALLDHASRESDAAIVRARAVGYLGNVARAAGDHARAAALYDEARRLLEAAGDRRFAATFAMDRAILALLAGDHARALAGLESLARDETTTTDALLDALVGHYRALARAALGLPCADPGDGKLPIGDYLARARRALADGAGVLDELEARAPANAHARATLEIVLRARRRAPAAERALVVSRHGSFFRLGDARVVMLTQRGPLARIVLALARARIERPGVAVAAGELVEAGWPGERVIASAAKNRLFVAIATLRKLGLRDALERRAAGYLVARDVSAVLVD